MNGRQLGQLAAVAFTGLFAAPTWAAPVLGTEAPADATVPGGAAARQTLGAIARGGSVTMAVWLSRDEGDTTNSILASPINGATGGGQTPAIVVDSTQAALEQPAIAFDGTRFVVTWKSSQSGAAHVVTRTIETTGTLGPIVDLTPTPTMVPTAPVVGGGGNHAVVAWADPDDIHAVLLGESTPIEITLPMRTSRRTAPAITYGNGRFLLVWMELPASGGPTPLAAAITIDAGMPVVGAPVVVSAPPATVTRTIDTSVAFGGDRFVVSFSSRRLGATRVYARLLDNTGTPVVGLNDIQISHDSTPNFHINAQVTFAQDRFVFVWERASPTAACATACSRFLANELDTSGAVLRATDVEVHSSYTQLIAPMLPGATQRQNAIAFDGTKIILLWSFQQTTGSVNDVMASVIDPTSLQAPTPGYAAASPAAVEHRVATANNGNVILAVWESTRDFTGIPGVTTVRGRIFNGQGTPAGPSFVVGQQLGSEPIDVAGLPSGDFLVVWASGETSRDIVAARVTPAGVVRDTSPIVIANASPAAEITPTVAAGTDRWLVGWRVENASSGVINARVVLSDGTMTSPLTLASDDSTAQALEPAAAFDGARFFVAMHLKRKNAADPDNIAGVFLATDGTTIGERPNIDTSTDATFGAPDVAGASGRLLVVWHETAGVPGVFGRSVSSTGSLGTTVPLALGPLIVRPHVALTSDRAIISMAKTVGMANLSQAIRARVPLTTNSVLDEGPFSLTVSPGTSDGNRSPAVTMLPSGQAFYAFDVNETFDGNVLVPRTHIRTGSTRQLGDICDNSSGCGNGVCVDGLCCESACVRNYDCAALNTECADFVPRQRCQGSGVCFAPEDTRACALTPKPDGMTCSAIGCTNAGSCMQGQCVCASLTVPPTAAAIVPQFANPGGCAYASSAGRPAHAASGKSRAGAIVGLLMIAAMALWRRRRRQAMLGAGAVLAAGLTLSGCGSSDPGGLIVRAELTRLLGKPVSKVRLILHAEGKQGFPEPAMVPSQSAGVRVFYANVDGAPGAETVIDVDKAYIKNGVLEVELTPSSGGAFPVLVKAFAFDLFGQRFAQSGNPEHAEIRPGETPRLNLELGCFDATCTGDGHTLGALHAVPALGDGATSAAIARAGLPTDPSFILVAHAGTGALASRVFAWLGETPPDPLSPLAWTNLGDRLGASMVAGDLDGDGRPEGLAGLPDMLCKSGGVGIIVGDVGQTTPPGIAASTVAGCPTPPPNVVPATFRYFGPGAQGMAPDAQLGASVAMGDVDGDGKDDLLVGSPGSKRVHVYRSGQPPVVLEEAALSGFGESVAVRKNLVLVSAPGNKVARMYTWQTDHLERTFEVTGSGGRFGASVALADLDGDLNPEIVVSAPDEGGGVVYIFSGAGRAMATNGTAGHSTATAVLRTGRGVYAGLGAKVLAKPAPDRFGDALVVLSSGDPGASLKPKLYLVDGSLLQVRPFVDVDQSDVPIPRFEFDNASSTFSSTGLAVGLVNNDITPDVLWVGPGQLATIRGTLWW